MANEIKHFVTTDGVTCDNHINVMIDLGNTIANDPTAQTVSGIYNTVSGYYNSLIGNNRDDLVNFYVTNFRYKLANGTYYNIGNASASIYGNPDLYTDYNAIVLNIDGYIVTITENDKVRYIPILTKSDLPSYVTVHNSESLSADKKALIIDTLKKGGEVIFFDSTSYANIKIHQYQIIPSSSAPVEKTITEWLSETGNGTLLLMFPYIPNSGSIVVKTVTIVRTNQTYNITVSS